MRNFKQYIFIFEDNDKNELFTKMYEFLNKKSAIKHSKELLANSCSNSLHKIIVKIK